MNISNRAFAILAATILLHLLFIATPLVNLEWAFADGARFFATHQKSYIEQYFAYQANTLGLPILTYILHSILPLDNESIIRLISLSGFILLADALLIFNRLLGSKLSPAWLLALVFLNPLIWVFGGRGTADFFPAALALFAVARLWDARDKPAQEIVAVLAFGMAITLKYHAALLLPLVALELFTRRDVPVPSKFTSLLFIGIGALTMPIAYIIITHQAFGFWLTPPAFQTAHALGISNILTTLCLYAAFLALLTLPFSAAFIWHRLGQWRNLHLRDTFKPLAISTALVVLGMIWLRPLGEMNFGPLDGMVAPEWIGAGLMLLAGVMVYAFKAGLAKYGDNAARRYAVCLMLGILLFIILLSFTRPAQRYLIFMLPLSYFFLLPVTAYSRTLLWGGAALYIVMNIILVGHQITAGIAANALTHELVTRGLIAATDPAVMEPHTGNHFFFYRTHAKHYEVVTGAPQHSLITVRKGSLPVISSSYSLVEKKVGCEQKH